VPRKSRLWPRNTPILYREFYASLLELAAVSGPWPCRRVEDRIEEPGHHLRSETARSCEPLTRVPCASMTLVEGPEGQHTTITGEQGSPGRQGRVHGPIARALRRHGRTSRCYLLTVIRRRCDRRRCAVPVLTHAQSCRYRGESSSDPPKGFVRLGSVSELIVDCEHKTAPTQPSGYPSIRTPNIGRGYFILDGVNRVSEETYRLWTRRAIPRPGDLIMAREAPVGNVAVVPEGLEPCLGQP
jgi:hypothetical protein